MKKSNGKNIVISDRAFYITVRVFLGFFALIVLYPLIYIFSCSISTPESVMSGEVVVFPGDFSLAGYKAVFRTNGILLGFRNSVFYTVVGTLINVVMTVICAYPLSRKDLPGQRVFMKLFTFTMIFSGGMIPTYLLIRDLHMLNTVWAILIPGAMGVYNMIITRTYFMNSIPSELLEAAKLDGCDDVSYLKRVALPLSKPILAVITLFYAVGHWNSYFSAFLYLSDQKLYPLQIYLRDILISNKINQDTMMDGIGDAPVFGLEYTLKYSLIVVAVVPMLVIYPFVQKHFVKGVMIGAIKG